MRVSAQGSLKHLLPHFGKRLVTDIAMLLETGPRYNAVRTLQWFAVDLDGAKVPWRQCSPDTDSSVSRKCARPSSRSAGFRQGTQGSPKSGDYREGRIQ
jgi:hypothetical protein